jgi:hypothetical protein
MTPTPSVSDKIESILNCAQPAIRDELSRHLYGCHFSDPDDPVLNSLVAQAIIAGQPIRLAESGGAPVATEAGLARLGDRVEATAWSVGSMKVATVLVACLLSVLIGGGIVLLGLKLWPEKMAGVLRLPREIDSRIEVLEKVGATLHVEQKEGTVYVYVTGENPPKAGQTRKGFNYLYIQP